MSNNKTKSRGELSRDIDSMKVDIKKLTAIIYWQRKILTYLEYTRSTSSFAYVPLTNSIKWDGNAGTHRSNSPADYKVPSLDYMFGLTMVDKVCAVEL